MEQIRAIQPRVMKVSQLKVDLHELDQRISSESGKIMGGATARSHIVDNREFVQLFTYRNCICSYMPCPWEEGNLAYKHQLQQGSCWNVGHCINLHVGKLPETATFNKYVVCPMSETCNSEGICHTLTPIWPQ